MKALPLLLALVGCGLAAETRPNILFLFSDDHALDAISAYGGPLKEVAPTPNLDRLAEEGAIFTRSYCCNSICGPSRAAILTGKHSHINGYIDNNNSTFDGSQTTFPKLLQKVGYQTAILGKWHLGSEPQGFDHWEVLPGQGSYYNPEFLQQGGGRKTYTGYVTDIITDMALEWLKQERDPDKPFVLMCQHKAPHRNWSPALRHADLWDKVDLPEPETLFDDYANRHPSLQKQKMEIADDFFWGWDMKMSGDARFSEYFLPGLANGEYERMNPEQQKQWDASYQEENQQLIAAIESGKLAGDAVTRWKYQRYLKDYLRCIRAVDEGVGRILDYLDQSGLAENTLVIYSSDQGFYLGEHGWYDKRWMFEESFAMPFLVRWPGKIAPGSRSEALIQNIDYAPTFLELAGAEIPETVQGRSLLPIFQNSGEAPADWREGLYYFYSGEATHRVAAHDGVCNERYKLMHFSEDPSWNLFDLEKDPQEMRSVHDDPAYAAVLAEMQELYAELRETYRMSESTVPQTRLQTKWWRGRFEQKKKEVAEGGHRLVFLGDSITMGWEGAGREVWEKYYKDRDALNLGYSGDCTEHVLWRLLNGELDGVDPEAFVLMIGTNNTGIRQAPAAETATGIQVILELLQDRCPEADIVLLSVFPRGEQPDDPLRKVNAEINQIIKGHADGESIHWVDLTSTFLDDQGVLPKKIMPDFLHLRPEGYRMWAEAMEPTLKKLLE